MLFIQGDFMKVHFFVALIIFLGVFTLNASEKTVSVVDSSKSSAVSYQFIDSDYQSTVLANNMSKGSLDLYKKNKEEKEKVAQSPVFHAFNILGNVFMAIFIISTITMFTGVLITLISGGIYDIYAASPGSFARNVYPYFYDYYYVTAYFNNYYNVSRSFWDPGYTIDVAYVGHLLTWISFGIWAVSLVGMIVFKVLAFVFKNKGSASMFIDSKDNGKLARVGVAIPLGLQY